MRNTEDGEARRKEETGENPPSPLAERRMAIAWQEQSAERRACYYQAYATARMALEAALAGSDGDRPKAVILDVDDTVLDTSPFFAGILERGDELRVDSIMKEFVEWLGRGESRAQPGAVEFLEYAKSRGVEPFYVTNRPARLMDLTVRNLEEQGCPNAIPERVILRDGPMDFFGGKKEQWAPVEEDYEVLLYIGDNLNDLSDIFRDRGPNAGFDEVDGARDLFGTRYILVPNPMYGSWEQALRKRG